MWRERRDSLARSRTAGRAKRSLGDRESPSRSSRPRTVCPSARRAARSASPRRRSTTGEKHDGPMSSEMQRLRQLREGRKLRNPAADLSRDEAMLQDVVKRKLRGLLADMRPSGAGRYLQGRSTIGSCSPRGARSARLAERVLGEPLPRAAAVGPEPHPRHARLPRRESGMDGLPAGLGSGASDLVLDRHVRPEALCVLRRQPWRERLGETCPQRAERRRLDAQRLAAAQRHERGDVCVERRRRGGRLGG